MANAFRTPAGVPHHRARRVWTAVAHVILWAAAAGAVWVHAGAARTHLAGDIVDADPPAYYTTGVLFHDLLRRPFVQPVAFAECFYVQYPKVAVGQWPPVFYIAEAIWFLLFSPARSAAQWLCGTITAAVAALLFERCRRRDGLFPATFAAALFLAFPSIQTEGWRVMSDVLLAVLVFFSLTRLAAFAVAPNRRNAASFAGLAALATLTKATACLLAVPFALAPLVAGRRGLYRRKLYWAALAGVCAVAAPFYLAIGTLDLGYTGGLEWHAERLRNMALALPASAWLIAAAGAAVLAWGIGRLPRSPVSAPAVEHCLLALWIAAQVLLIAAVPLTPELGRYLIPSLLAALALASAALAWLGRGADGASRYAAQPLIALLAAAAVLGCGRVDLRPTRAYSQITGRIPQRPSPTVIFVDADAGGEGAVIAARLEGDRDRSTYVVRSSKALAVSDWGGGQYAMRYRSAEDVLQLLDRNAAEYVITTTRKARPPHSALVEKALAQAPDTWIESGREPLRPGSDTGELLLYRRAVPEPPAGAPPASVQLGPDRASRTISCPEPRR